MIRLKTGFALVLVGLLATACLLQTDTQAQDKAPPKLKGRLPKNFGKLGLRDDQRQDIYRIQANYRSRIDDLQRQLDQLRSEERAAIEKVLTPEQLKRLRELRSGEKGGEAPPRERPGKTKPGKDKDKGKDKEKPAHKDKAKDN